MEAIKDLPKAKRSGAIPDADPRFAHILAEAWGASRDQDKATALGTPFRHSDAGKCARYLSYVAAGLPVSDPMDLTGIWTTGMGERLHEEWQAALAARYPDAEIEVKVRMEGADGSGHIDAVVVADSTTIAYELKTVGGYAYKGAVGAMSKGKAAEGPKSEHLIQAALNGVGADADQVVIGRAGILTPRSHWLTAGWLTCSARASTFCVRSLDWRRVRIRLPTAWAGVEGMLYKLVINPITVKPLIRRISRCNYSAVTTPVMNGYIVAVRSGLQSPLCPIPPVPPLVSPSGRRRSAATWTPRADPWSGSARRWPA